MPMSTGMRPGLVPLDSGLELGVSFLSVPMTRFTGFKHKKLLIDNFTPGNSGTNLYMRFSTDGCATFYSGASDYQWSLQTNVAPSSPVDAGSGADSAITLVTAANNASGLGFFGEINLFSTNSSATRTRAIYDISSYNTLGSILTGRGSAGSNLTQDTDGVQLYPGSGVIASIGWALYGWN